MAVLAQYGARSRNLTVRIGTPTERMIGTIRSSDGGIAFLIALILVVVFDNPVLSNVIWVILVASGQFSRYLLRQRERRNRQRPPTSGELLPHFVALFSTSNFVTVFATSARGIQCSIYFTSWK